jgi:orotate phosphoribosyltransferase
MYALSAGQGALAVSHNVGFSDEDREQLCFLVERDALLHGGFELASGQESSFYFDSKPVTLSPTGARLVGQAFIDAIGSHAPNADAVGGLTLGADPIISSVVLLSESTRQPLKGLIVRKEQKSHGTERLIEGPRAGVSEVVVVDDVVTSGASARQAVEGLRNSGLTVVLAIALIDRLAGFEETMRELGVPTHAILTIDDLNQRSAERPAAATAAVAAT